MADDLNMALPRATREVPNRNVDPLLGKMWKTKSARFNAQARLSTKHTLSIAAISILSFYLFVASLIDLFQRSAPTGSSKSLALVTVIISVLFIIISLLENSRNYQREADRMHQCALEISEVYNRFQALPLDRADEERMKYTGSYSEILSRFEINHKDIDSMKFQLAFARELRISGFSLVALYLKYLMYWLAEYALYICLLVGPPFLFIFFRPQLGW